MMHFFGAILISLVVSCANAATTQATEVNNAAGGLSKNGQYVTVGSSRVPVQATALTANEIPALGNLMKRISGLPVTSQLKANLLGAMYAGGPRTYYRANDAKISQEQLNSIIQAYVNKLKIRSQEFVLFALTEPATKTTILFPPFFQLTETEKEAILLHEAGWIVNPQMTYDQMIDLEMAAQKYFEQSEDAEITFNFFYHLTQTATDDVTSLLMSTLAYDVKHTSALFVDSKNDKISLKEMFGVDFLNCISLGSSMNESACLAPLRVYAIEKASTDSGSLFRRALVQYASDPDNSVHIESPGGVMDQNGQVKSDLYVNISSARWGGVLSFQIVGENHVGDLSDIYFYCKRYK